MTPLSSFFSDPDDTTGAIPELDTILSRLLACNNREIVDQLALDFCYINNKGSRKRLAKSIMSFSQSQQGLDLIPYFARLVATLNAVIPDIGALIVDAVLPLSLAFLHVCPHLTLLVISVFAAPGGS